MSRLPVFPPGLQRSSASPDPASSAQGRGSALASSHESASNRSSGTFDDVLAELEEAAGLAPTTPLIAQATTTIPIPVGFDPATVTVELPDSTSDPFAAAGPAIDSLLPGQGAGSFHFAPLAEGGGQPGLQAAPPAPLLPETAGPESGPLLPNASGSIAAVPQPPVSSASPASATSALTEQILNAASQPGDALTPLQTPTSGVAERLQQLIQESPGSAANAGAEPSQAGQPAGPQLDAPGPVRVVSLQTDRLPQPQTNPTSASTLPAAAAVTAVVSGSATVGAAAADAPAVGTDGTIVADLIGDDGLDVSRRDSSEAGSRTANADSARIENLQAIESRTSTATLTKVEAATVSQQIARTVVQRVQWETVDTRTHMTLELQPATLGTVQVVLELERKELSIQIITQSESIRAVVEAQLNDLTTLLRQAGIDFSGCDVTCQDSEADKWEEALEQRPGSGSGQPNPGESDSDRPAEPTGSAGRDGAVDLVA